MATTRGVLFLGHPSHRLRGRGAGFLLGLGEVLRQPGPALGRGHGHRNNLLHLVQPRPRRHPRGTGPRTAAAPARSTGRGKKSAGRESRLPTPRSSSPAPPDRRRSRRRRRRRARPRSWGRGRAWLSPDRASQQGLLGEGARRGRDRRWSCPPCHFPRQHKPCQSRRSLGDRPHRLAEGQIPSRRLYEEDRRHHGQSQATAPTSNPVV